MCVIHTDSSRQVLGQILDIPLLPIRSSCFQNLASENRNRRFSPPYTHPLPFPSYRHASLCPTMPSCGVPYIAQSEQADGYGDDDRPSIRRTQRYFPFFPEVLATLPGSMEPVIAKLQT